MPPSVARKTLSVRNCRISRRRLAPTARRRAISFLRAMARVKSRFDTFAQAISRTKVTVPSRMNSVDRIGPTTFSCSATTEIPSLALVRG